MGCFNIGNHAERSELKDFLLIKSTKKEGEANKLGDFFFCPSPEKKWYLGFCSSDN